MANRKRGFFASLFGKRKQTEQEERAELESKQRLEARIQQILAERAVVPELLKMEENQAPEIPREEEAELPVELLPISASVISIRKTPVAAPFLLLNEEDFRTYAANGRR